MNKLIRFFSTIFLCLFFLLSSCKAPQQDPRFMFKDNKLPRMLEKTANQFRELPEKRIIDRMKSEAKRKDLFTVAVIDNGFDLSHPLLVDKINFKVKNNKITGAGYDILGNDLFPSANLIDASLYAFAAEKYENGIITPSKTEPLDLIYESQVEFYKILMSKIASHPDLKDSIYSRKLELSSILFFEALPELEELRKDLQKANNNNVKTFPLEAFTSTSDSILTEKLSFAKQHIYSFYHEAWNSQNQESPILDVKSYFDRNTEMNQVLVETIEEFRSKKDLQINIDNLVRFMSAQEGKTANESNLNYSDAIKKLKNAFYFKYLGPNINNPIFQLAKELKGKIILDRLIASGQQIPEKILITKEVLLQESDKLFNNLFELLDADIEKEKQNNSVDYIKYKQLRKSKDWYKNYLRGLISEVSEAAIDTLNPKLFKADNDFVRFQLKTMHPYIFSESNSASHGTHVLSTILAQSDKLRGFLIRVLTQSFSMHKDYTSIVKNQTINKFQEWLNDPLIYSATEERLRKLFGNVSPKGKVISQGEKVKLLMKKIAPYINTYVDSKTLDVEFIGQILLAIDEVAQQKVKITNISLGLENQAEVLNLNSELDINAKKVQEVKFLMFEFAKYQLGKALKEKAPNTLFIVAAGNSGKWIDAEAQSALPVDLTSPWLKKYETDTLKAPNNHLKNILGVGSINEAGNRLSGFSNLVLGSETPIIFAVGENVTAAIKSTDNSFVSSAVNNLSPETSLLRLIGNKKLVMDDDNYFFNSNISLKISRFLNYFQEFLYLNVLSKTKTVLGRMSGTSMAAPDVAGLIAKEEQIKMEKMGLSYEQIYDHKEFTPENLISRAMEKTQPLRSGNIVDQLRKLVGEKEYNDKPILLSVKKVINKFNPKKLSRAATKCLQSYTPVLVNFD